MDAHKEKELDDLIRKAVIEAGVEEPAPNLKSGIMQALSRKYAKVAYSALISKRAWGGLAAVLLLFVCFVWYNPLGLQPLGVDLFSWDIPFLSWTVSSTVLYGMVGLGLMVGLQVFLLKRRIDNTRS